MADRSTLPDDCSKGFQDSPARAWAKTEVQAITRWQQSTYKETKNMGLLQRLTGFFSGSDNASPAPMTYVFPADEDDENETGGPVTTALNLPAAGRGKLTTSTMTQEQLRARRMHLVESAKHGRPFHEQVMLFFLRLWLFLGPIAFVALTTSEVAYILTSLVAPGDHATLIIWGGALFIDLAMMFTTFGVAIKRRDLAEKREIDGAVSAREEGEVWLGTIMWLIFAAINIVSQSAFLLHIIQASHDPNMNLLYIFVASRVTGFILGDAVTAFFLAKVDNSALKLIARGEREKATLYRDIAQAEGERQLVEAKSEADIMLIRIRVQQEQDDARFLATLKAQVFKDILERRSAPPPAVPPPAPSDDRRPRGGGASRLDQQ